MYCFDHHNLSSFRRQPSLLVKSPTNLALWIPENILFSVLVCQQRFINLLFLLLMAPGIQLPLPIRWAVGKVYHFCRLHSVCTIAATVWASLFTIAALCVRLGAGIYPGNQVPIPSSATVVLTFVTVSLVTMIMTVLSLPPLRFRYHNWFEMLQRFLGRSVLLMIWARTILPTNDYKTINTTVTVAFFFCSAVPSDCDCNICRIILVVPPKVTCWDYRRIGPRNYC